jgi:Fic family protein
MPKNEKVGSQSHYVTSTVSGERVRAFVPPPLPPGPGALDLTSLQAILAEANQSVGRLDGITSALPDLKLFLYSYVRKEAVLSSQIEGTQSSLSDLLLYENAETPGVPLDDVQEVSNYVAALNQWPQTNARRLSTFPSAPTGDP